ncbi:MAG: hypothetical protein CBE23_000880 [Candidatus Pelagibacter sp. TMED263]|nr:MAG: hypothetical protein CBE23_000880 [Candidatus Pelagibacter sp. TMED263]
MKNNVLKLIEYLYYFSLVALFILYLFPGSLIGYLLYGDLGKQPNLVDNPIGTSINHLFYFMYLSALAIICNLKKIQILTNFYFIIFISVFLEASHYIIPNRAFELYDLFANVAGVLMIFLVGKLIK